MSEPPDPPETRPPRPPWADRVRAGLRFVLLGLVAHLTAVLLLLPIVARWLAPLGWLLPWKGPRAFAVSLLLDLPSVLVTAPAAWILGRIGEGCPSRRALRLVVALWLYDALTSLFVTQNFDRWLDGWSATARAGAMAAAWAVGRRVLARSAPGAAGRT